MVAESVVESLGEMGLVEHEWVDDEKEEMGDSLFGGAEERGPDHGANDKPIVKANCPAVANGRPGNGEHGQSGGDRVEAQ
jgi:hypothetical protein